MKKKVFFGTLAAMIFSIHISAFAAPTAAFGDVSAGNHIAAPYAKSDIIVPQSTLHCKNMRISGFLRM